VILQRAEKRDAASSPTKRSNSVSGLSRHFGTIEQLVEYATKNWRENLVTTDIVREDELEVLTKRPFFLLVSIDAPMMTRWARYRERCEVLDEVIPDLESFIHATDLDFYGSHLGHKDLTSGETDQETTGNAVVFHKASLRIVNTYRTLRDLYRHLDELDMTNPDRIRPSWDAYFMRLASLASLRSNCMKRRVGCVLVRNNRVISTGYNGTPRGITNCNEGGCGRCNSAQAGGVGLGTCLCLHAEENALLESGRERVGDAATLYCNTCPCLTCSVKIAQVGVKEVIYNQAYSMDEKSAEILREAGVLLRQFSPPYEG